MDHNRSMDGHREHDDTWFVPLADMDGLGIDVGSGDRPSHDSDTDIAPLPKETPTASEGHTSPPSTREFSGSTQCGLSPAKTLNSPQNKSRPESSTPYQFSQGQEDPEASLLRKHHSVSTFHSTYGDFAAHHKCESVKGVKGSRRSWSSIITIILSVYSTLLSGVFVMVALIGPDYKIITTDGKVTPSSSTLVSAILAKTIELSFVTVIIALLGQELSRRASSARRRSGVTLAELSMRGWISQPGTMLSRWESVRYAGLSTLGLICIIAALLAMLYTSAAAALVQPQLIAGKWHDRVLQGFVRSSFANLNHIAEDCYIPIPLAEDPDEHNDTCSSIEHAAAAYKNYYTYLGKWSDKTHGVSASDRPSGTAWFGNDTMVLSPWVGNKLNSTAVSLSDPKTGIIVNNVSLAYPHTGVIPAAKNPLNMISQPKDLDGVGRYTINASVPSPVVHSLCATVSEEHLAPLIFDKWNVDQVPLDHEKWPAQLHYANDYLNATVLDDIFEWGPKYGESAW